MYAHTKAASCINYFYRDVILRWPLLFKFFFFPVRNDIKPRPVKREFNAHAKKFRFRAETFLQNDPLSTCLRTVVSLNLESCTARW